MDEKKKNVEYVTSLAFAFPVDQELKHFQLTIVRDVDTKEFGCYFDVVDPSKIKLADE